MEGMSRARQGCLLLRDNAIVCLGGRVGAQAKESPVVVVAAEWRRERHLHSPGSHSFYGIGCCMHQKSRSMKSTRDTNLSRVICTYRLSPHHDMYVKLIPALHGAVRPMSSIIKIGGS